MSDFPSYKRIRAAHGTAAQWAASSRIPAEDELITVDGELKVGDGVTSALALPTTTDAVATAVLFRDTFTRTDGTLSGSKGETGPVWGVTGAGYLTAAVQSGRYVSNGVSYVSPGPLASQPVVIGGEFSFEAGANGGDTQGLALMSSSDDTITLGHMVHLTFSRTSARLTWWAPGDIDNELATGTSNLTFTTPLATDGTVHRVAMAIAGDQVRVDFSNGQSMTASDPMVRECAGRLPIWEILSSAASAFRGRWDSVHAGSDATAFSALLGASVHANEFTALQSSVENRAAPTAVKTAAYTAVANDLVKVDITGGTVPVTLPTAPPIGAKVTVKIVAATEGSANVVTVTRGGADVINASATSLTIKRQNQAVTLQYTSGTWDVISGDLPTSAFKSGPSTISYFGNPTDSDGATSAHPEWAGLMKGSTDPLTVTDQVTYEVGVNVPFRMKTYREAVNGGTATTYTLTYSSGTDSMVGVA